MRTWFLPDCREWLATPPGLDYWMDESKFQEIYINLLTDYGDFQSCVHGAIEKGLEPRQFLVGLREKGYGDDLRDDLLAFVKPDYKQASEAKDQQPSAAYLSQLIGSSTQFMLSSEPDDSYRLRLRRAAAGVSINLAIASGDELECKPPNGLLYWIDRARHANL